MSDLISRDALFAEFENAGWYDLADRDEVAEELLLHAPTVDAIPVVKCQQCAFCDRSPCPARDPETGKTRNCIKYCSIGERKDGEK